MNRYGLNRCENTTKPFRTCALSVAGISPTSGVTAPASSAAAMSNAAPVNSRRVASVKGGGTGTGSNSTPRPDRLADLRYRKLGQIVGVFYRARARRALWTRLRAPVTLIRKRTISLLTPKALAASRRDSPRRTIRRAASSEMSKAPASQLASSSSSPSQSRQPRWSSAWVGGCIRRAWDSSCAMSLTWR